jgi:branched-subunit amino acid aminotransferase/4-amino-4-deoxychorismate lyase
VITIEDQRNYLKIYKTTDRTVSDHAKKLAFEKGADDALFINDGNIIESTICNVFSINKQGEIITPLIQAKGLNGITRQLIMKHTNVIETDIKQNTNSPLVLVNALRLQKVTHLNGKKLQDGTSLMQRIQTIINSVETGYLNQ